MKARGQIQKHETTRNRNAPTESSDPLTRSSSLSSSSPSSSPPSSSFSHPNIRAKEVKVEILESRIRFSARRCTLNGARTRRKGGMKARVARPRLENVWDYVKERERRKKRKAKADCVSRRWQAALAKPTTLVHERVVPYASSNVLLLPPPCSSV